MGPDRHLIDTRVHVSNLGGDLRLESKAIFLDGDRLDDLAPENLEAGFHVRKVEVGEHV